MRWFAILLLGLVGCSSPNPPAEPCAPVDAGVDAPNCIPIRWHFGGTRHCDECVCAGTPCETSNTEGVVAVGTCGADLKCSAECKDPLWVEMHPGTSLDAGVDAQTDADACVAEVSTDGVWYCESCACGATECRVRNGQTGVTTVGTCSESLECSEPCPATL